MLGSERVNVPFPNLLKTLESKRFSELFRGTQKKGCNGLLSHYFRDRPQILLLILSKFKQLNKIIRKLKEF